MNETEESNAEGERYRLQINEIEKKQQALEKNVEHWHNQCELLASELDKAQEETRRFTADVYAIQTASTSLSEQSEDLKRENKTLAVELRDLGDQLRASERNSHDVTKKVNALELEKDELQRQLEEAESTLEIEEAKVLRVGNYFLAFIFLRV